MSGAGRPAVVTLVSRRAALGPDGLVGLARAAAAAGVDFFQVREKDLPARALRALVAQVIDAVRGSSTRVLVNGRADIAQAAGAAGVQLPENGLPVSEVKRVFPSLVAGVSCHSIEAALRAEDGGADFVLLGPVFATPGKEGRALGLAPVAEAARRLRVPVHAIGGIEATNAQAVREAGARGVAAIRAFLHPPLEDVVRALKVAAP